jgi:RNA polymerase sigma-70 factor (ECF subfamily)
MNTGSDEARFDALFRATRKDILAYFARRAPASDNAADLLAETYLIAWRRLNDIPAAPEDRLWLFGVARNLLKKSAERRRAQAALVERLADELELAFQARALLPVEDDRAEVLQAGLLRLPEKEREIMLLTAWEGMMPREIATVTRSSANVVRVRLARARRKLRAYLTEQPERETANVRAVASRID